MYQLKAFVSIETLIANDAGVISPVGELSSFSQTYTKERGVYNLDAYPLLTLHAFKSAYTDTGFAKVPSLVQHAVLALSDWMLTTQMLPGSVQTRTAFLTLLIEQFSATATSLNCGEMVLLEGDVWFPEWISWQQTDLPSAQPASTNALMVWFSDASFRQQYNEYEIVVVPPLLPLDRFFAGASAVRADLSARLLPAILSDIQTARNFIPESVMSGESFDYVDPTNPTNRVSTSWTLLIYGKSGDNLDAVREAIQAYIAANSTHSVTEWKLIFPDIYKTTEFLIYPRWHNYAIPDRMLQAGIYSPVVSLKKEVDYLKAVLPLIEPTHIETHAAVLPCTYKSLALLLLAGPDNRNGKFAITLVYPDIINVPTSDTLFEAMAESTQEWVLQMERMVIAAESMTTYSDPPDGFRKVLRAGVLYVTAKINNIAYLVASKASTPAY